MPRRSLLYFMMALSFMHASVSQGGLRKLRKSYRQHPQARQLASYMQAFPSSCGAACAITALTEIGYDMPLNKKTEAKAYAVTGIKSGDMIRLLHEAGKIGAVQSLFMHIIKPQAFRDQRISPTHALVAFLKRMEANATLWFDPGYIKRLQEDAAFPEYMRLLGTYVSEKTGALPSRQLRLEDLDDYLGAGGRLIIPFTSRHHSHYYLLRMHQGELVVMDPGPGINFPAPAGFLKEMLEGNGMNIGYDHGLYFIGVVIGVVGNPCNDSGLQSS